MNITVYIDGPAIKELSESSSEVIDWNMLKQFLTDNYFIKDIRYYGDDLLSQKEINYFQNINFRVINKGLGRVWQDIANQMKQAQDSTDIFFIISNNPFLANIFQEMISLGKKVIICWKKDNLSPKLIDPRLKHLHLENFFQNDHANTVISPVDFSESTYDHTKERVIIFIDEPNLNGMQNELRTCFNHISLVEALTENRSLVEARFYIYSPRDAKAENFHNFLKNCERFTVITTGDQDVDYYLLNDLKDSAEKKLADVFILVSGDHVYYQTINTIIESGIQVEVFCNHDSIYKEYKKIARFRDPAKLLDSISHPERTHKWFGDERHENGNGNSKENNFIDTLFSLTPDEAFERLKTSGIREASFKILREGFLYEFNLKVTSE